MASTIQQRENARLLQLQQNGYFEDAQKTLENQLTARQKTQAPGWLGYDTATDQATIAEKGLGSRLLSDAGNLGYGLLTLASKAATLPFRTAYGLVTDPKETIRETGEGAKTIAGAVVKGFKDPLAALGVFGDEEKEAARTYYKAHPGFAVLDALGIASLGAGTLLKSGITGGAKAATTAVAREAAVLGVKSSVVDAVMLSTRGAFNPKLWVGAATKAATPLREGIVKAVRTGDVNYVGEVLKTQFIQKGVNPEVAVKLAQSATDEIAKQMSKHSTKIKVLDALDRPFSALSRGTSNALKVVIGDPAQSAVVRVFGNEAVKANKRAALEIEQWLDAIVRQEQGLPSTPNNRAVELMTWMERPEYAVLSPEEKFAHFRNYINADVRTANLRSLTNNANFVPVRVISKDAAEAMKSNIADNIETIKREVNESAEVGTVVDRTWTQISDILQQTSGRDFINNQHTLRQVFGDTGSVEKLYSAIDSLTNKRSSVDFSEWSPEAQKIASDLEGTGYRIGLAAADKPVSLVSEIVGKEISPELQPFVQEARKYKNAEEFVKAHTPVFRGGEALDISRIGDRGLPVTKDRKVAETFLRAKEDFRKGLPFLERPPVGLEEGFISTSAKIATRKDVPDDVFRAYKEANPVLKPEVAEPIIGKWAKVNGFDAIDFSTLGKTSAKEAEIKIYNPDIIKTKSQLIDIWKEATSREIAQIPRVPASVLDSQRGYVGKILDKWGFSPNATPEGSSSFFFREGFNQLALKELTKKFGNVLTIKDAFGKGRTLKVPVSELYDFLRKNIDRVNKIRREEAEGSLLQMKAPLVEGTKLSRVFDYSRGILRDRVKFPDEVANAIDQINRKAQRNIPLEVTGIGDKIVDLMRAGSRDLGIYGRHFDRYIKAAAYLRYRSAAAFMFQMQQGFETALHGSMLLGGKQIPGAGLVAKLSNHLPLERFGKIAERMKPVLQKMASSPSADDVALMEKYVVPSVYRGLDDVSSSVELSQIHQQLSTSRGVVAGNKMANVYKNHIQMWAVDKITKISSAYAEKFGMTLKEVFEENADGSFKNPRMARDVRELSQQLLYYKQGFLTSPLARTMNLVFFPFRFQAKTLQVTAQWLQNLSPATRLAVIENWIHFSNWAGTEDGIAWRREHKNWLYNFLAYATAYEQIGDSITALGRIESLKQSPTQLFGGNAGLIGGIPFSWMVEFARDLAVIPEDPETYDPRTGRPFEIRETPRDPVSWATFTKLVEEYFATLMPGMPFYTLTGGFITKADVKRIPKNIIEGVYGAILAGSENLPVQAKDALIREQFMKVRMDETVPLFNR